MFPMQNNTVKVIGADNCLDCMVLFCLIEDYIKQKKLDVKIEKIQSISDEAINLAIEFNINTIPFAIFNKNMLIFDKKTTNRSDIEDFFT